MGLEPITWSRKEKLNRLALPGWARLHIHYLTICNLFRMSVGKLPNLSSLRSGSCMRAVLTGSPRGTTTPWPAGTLLRGADSNHRRSAYETELEPSPVHLAFLLFTIILTILFQIVYDPQSTKYKNNQSNYDL